MLGFFGHHDRNFKSLFKKPPEDIGGFIGGNAARYTQNNSFWIDHFLNSLSDACDRGCVPILILRRVHFVHLLRMVSGMASEVEPLSDAFFPACPAGRPPVRLSATCLASIFPWVISSRAMVVNLSEAGFWMRQGLPSESSVARLAAMRTSRYTLPPECGNNSSIDLCSMNLPPFYVMM